MAGSALAPIIGTVFSKAAGATVFSSFAAKAVGGLVAGWGAGKLEEARSKEEERQQIEEENRQSERYSGSGDATRAWDAPIQQTDTQNGTDYERVTTGVDDKSKVGSQDNQMGAKYRSKKNNTPPSFRYDPDSGRIIKS